MANYVPSDLVKAQAKLMGKFKDSELRYRDPVLFKEFLRVGQIAMPNFGSLRTREDRPVEAYFKNRTSRALGTARVHNHVGTKGDSTAFTPTYLERTDKFALSLKQGDNNVYSNPEMLSNEFENVVANFSEGFESLAASHIFNNRSQVSTASSELAFDGVTFVNELTAANVEDRAIQITKSAMRENKYSGSLVVVCDTVAFNKFGYQANQGNANNQNLEFQFGGVRFIESIEMNSLASGLGYTAGFWVSFEEGSVAGLPWIPKQNKQGSSSTVNTYGTILNPVDGQTYAVHSYEERADESATNGYTQDVRTEFEVSLDVAFEHAPLTTANETPLQAFGLI